MLTLTNEACFNPESPVWEFPVSLKGLVEVITSNDDQLAIRATILLGELLHMVISNPLFAH